MRCQKRRQIFKTGFFENRQIAAVNHAQSAFAGRNHQPAKIRIQLRRTTGQVDRRYVRAGRQKSDYRVDRFAGHLFLAGRASVDVAVQATLVAAVAEVQLQRLNRPPRKGREVGTKKQGQHGMHQGAPKGPAS